MNEPYFYFRALGVILCGYHKDKLLEKEPGHEFEPFDQGQQLISDYCERCTSIIVQYEREVD